MTLGEIKNEIAELEAKLKSYNEKIAEITSRLHHLYVYENQHEEYSAGMY